MKLQMNEHKRKKATYESEPKLSVLLLKILRIKGALPVIKNVVLQK